MSKTRTTTYRIVQGEHGWFWQLIAPVTKGQEAEGQTEQLIDASGVFPEKADAEANRDWHRKERHG